MKKWKIKPRRVEGFIFPMWKKAKAKEQTRVCPLVLQVVDDGHLLGFAKMVHDLPDLFVWKRVAEVLLRLDVYREVVRHTIWREASCGQ